MIILLLLQITACGKDINETTVHVDPETHAEISRNNMNTLEGDWAINLGEGQDMQIAFHGDRYRLNLLKEGVVIASDEGSLEHFLPGEVLLKSTLPACADRSALRFDFEKIQGSMNFWTLTDDVGTRVLSYKMSSPIEPSIRSNKCLFAVELK